MPRLQFDVSDLKIVMRGIPPRAKNELIAILQQQGARAELEMTLETDVIVCDNPQSLRWRKARSGGC